jgi:hypothetical protein
MLGCSKTLKNIFDKPNNKNQPIKPKISSTDDSYQGKTMIFNEKSANAILEISAILK